MSSGTLIHRRYVISHLLGEGAFGKVYQGIHQKTNEPVAIKISTTNQLSLLRNEASILNYLYNQGCRNIPTVYWYGLVHSTHLCMVIPYYTTCLFDARSKRAFSPQQINNIALQALKIFDEIHSKFVLHRDIKPHNFMVHEGELILIDFGIATFYLDSSTAHSPQQQSNLTEITGSPKYMSNHLHSGCNASRRDDLISFGYVLLFLLYGQLDWDSIPPSPSNYQERYSINHLYHYNNVVRGQKKSMQVIETYCKSEALLSYLRYTYSLKYDERPNYEMCQKLFYSKTI